MLEITSFFFSLHYFVNFVSFKVCDDYLALFKTFFSLKFIGVNISPSNHTGYCWGKVYVCIKEQIYRINHKINPKALDVKTQHLCIDAGCVINCA